jgi:hypothetical protein
MRCKNLLIETRTFRNGNVLKQQDYGGDWKSGSKGLQKIVIDRGGVYLLQSFRNILQYPDWETARCGPPWLRIQPRRDSEENHDKCNSKDGDEEEQPGLL